MFSERMFSFFNVKGNIRTEIQNEEEEQEDALEILCLYE